jgi:NADPH-dependent curcumin reductase CurA
MNLLNEKIILRSRPSGEVKPDNFDIIKNEIPIPGENEILVKARYFSVDPYMRNRMNNVESYVEPYKLDSAVSGDAIAEVIESNSEKFKEGDLIVGSLPWQKYSVPRLSLIEKIEPDGNIPTTAYLGILGLTGLTAYFGLFDIGNPKPGETIVISAAAGAVGSVAGQMAKIKNCKVIGVTGSEKKSAYLLDELHFDEAIDYKKTPNTRKALRKLCPQRVDIYFDNVGGDISDGVFYWLNDFARIILCGQIALYNLSRLSMGPRLYPQFIIHRVKMQGFIVYDYIDRFQEARDQIKQWLIEDKIKYAENIVEGFENIPAAFLGLFAGDNIGKQLVKV